MFVLCVHRSQLLNVCGVPGVQFSDLAHPHPKRFIRNLSAIINFAKFREERVTVYGELTQGLVQLPSAVVWFPLAAVIPPLTLNTCAA